MLFGLRSTLAVTFLAGLAPLSVFGAPLSQVEDGIVRRALPEGHKVTIDGKEHTLGAPIGNPGSTATVHHVEGHDNIVAKVFNPGGVAPKDQRLEAEHLQKVGEFHGSGDADGHHVVLATKHDGKKLEDTEAWKNADTKKKQNEVKAKASSLTVDRNQHHADNHNIIHTDTNNGNVLFHEDKNGLNAARFVDWGLAKHVTPGTDGNFDKKTKDKITQSGKTVVRGVTPHSTQPADTSASSSKKKRKADETTGSGASGSDVKGKKKKV
jgi:hypothetical protein